MPEMSEHHGQGRPRIRLYRSWPFLPAHPRARLLAVLSRRLVRLRNAETRRTREQPIQPPAGE